MVEFVIKVDDKYYNDAITNNVKKLTTTTYYNSNTVLYSYSNWVLPVIYIK